MEKKHGTIKNNENSEKLLDPVLAEAASKENQGEYRLYKRRWFILFLYVMYGCSSAMQWVEYCIITNLVEKYYNVTAQTVDWTSLVTMVTYPPLLIPGTYIIDKMGLRVSALLGAVGTTIGTWIKVFSVHPDLFWVTFLGQTVVFVSQIFILSLPPKLAAVWFGENEVSRACGIGVFGQQLGTAIGFVVPPLIVKDHDNIEDIGKELSILFYVVAAFTTPVAILVIIFFKKEPKFPPSRAQALERELNLSENYTIKDLVSSYKSLLTNKPFMYLSLCYGLNVGVFAALCTVLNQFVLSYFPNSAKDAGLIGLLMTVVGMLGSVMFGYILDKTRRYKEVTITVYVLTFLGVCGFMFSLETYSKVCVYIAGAILGFFMNSYYAVGFEMAAELTYPQPESTSSGILICAAQTFGITLILMSGSMIQTLGTFWALFAMCGSLFIGSILTAFTPNILLRQQAFAGGSVSNGVIFTSVPVDEPIKDPIRNKIKD